MSGHWTTILHAALTAVVGLSLQPSRAAAAAWQESYVIRGWQVEDGLPQNRITTAVQTRDGYLWLGSYGGLARFDGVAFTLFEHRTTPAVRASGVTALFEDGAGVLWIGHAQGELSRYQAGRFEEVPPGVVKGKILQIAADERGEVWALAQPGFLLRCRDGLVLTPPSGAASGITMMDRGRDNTLWVIRNGALSHLARGKFSSLPAPPDGGLDYVHGVGPAVDGLWVVYSGRVQKWRDAGWAGEPFAAPWGTAPVQKLAESEGGELLASTADRGLFVISPSTPTNTVHLCRTNGFATDWTTCLVADHEGGIWVGTGGAGLFALRARRAHTFNPPDDWQGRTVLGICAGCEGSLWMGTEGAGVYRFKGGQWSRFSQEQGMHAYAWSIVEDREGVVWVGTWGGGLFRFDGERFHHVDIPALEGSPLPALAACRNGGLWIGTDHGLVRYDKGETRLCGQAPVQGMALVRSIVEETNGAVWFGTSGAGLGQLKDGVVRYYGKSDGLSSEYIESLFLDSAGDLWVGTSGEGLTWLHDGRFSRVSKQEGLPSDTICHIEEDTQGFFWMSSHDGLIRARRADLLHCAPGRTPQFLTCGLSDGMPTVRASSGMSPSGCRSADGRLWFPTSKGLVYVNPVRVRPNLQAPPVVVESMLVDDRPVELKASASQPLRIAAGRHRFEFHYTGLSLAAPERVRFKYLMEGLEQDWVEAGARRSVYYSHIPPGRYAFRVQASNNDGIWNEAGAVLHFEVAPFWWQTVWFWVLFGSGVIGATGATVWFGTRSRMRRKLALLEYQRAVEYERSRIARDIHDDLGSHLTRITMLSESARSELAHPENAAGALENIYSTARELTRAMDEIVWAVNPKHDTLEGLLNYLEKYAQDFLRTAAIRCRIDFPLTLPGWTLRAEVRHNLFLAFKEALNNSVKHSRAAVVQLSLKLEEDGFILQVQDDGTGFDVDSGGNGRSPSPGKTETPGRITGGDGLANMRRRLTGCGGSFEMASAPGKGTRVTFRVPREAL